jgi:3-oxoadipate enol-lactonase
MPADASRVPVAEARAYDAVMPSSDMFVEVPGGRLKVVVEGEGPPILLVHSAIVDLRSWDALVPHLVAAGYKVVRYDIRGYGESTTDDVDFSNRDDLVAVLDAVGADKVAIVGNSRGAMIGLDSLLQYPDRFVAFAWVGGGIGGYESGGPTPEEQPIWEEGERLEAAGDAEGMADLDVRVWVDGIGQPPTRVPSQLREAVRAMDRPLVEPARVFGKPIPLDPPANERLGTIRVPVLVVVGALDTSGTRASAVRLEEGVPGARRVVIADVAHLIGMEVPEALAELIVELLAPLPRWT